MRKALLVVSVVMLMAPPLVRAQTLPASPAAVAYQGRLADDSSAAPLLPDGFYEMTFLIFDAQTSGNLLWSETQPAVELTAGIYHVALGSVAPLDFSVFNSPNGWLEVRVFGEVLSARRRIVSVPFALKAEGEVPAGAVILGQLFADPAILGLGYTQEGSTIGPYFLYRKSAYNPAANRVPQMISYQGRALPQDGHTLGPSADLGFSLFTTSAGNTLLWSELQPGAAIPGGLIDVDLGAFNPIYPTHLSSADLWLEVTVNGQALAPREKLAAAPYALKTESPVPPGGIVLSTAAANPGLTAKKFSPAGGAVSGYYPFKKDVFSAASPSTPLLIGYQGRLRSASGAATAGPVDLGFYLYGAASGGTLLWSETIAGVTMEQGIFNVLLGAGSTITPDTFTGPQAYLEVRVKQGATVENLTPRDRITSVPFAMQAEGTMPETAMVLAATTTEQSLLNAGFKFSGSMIGAYYVYGKFDLDTVAPEIIFVEPLDATTTVVNQSLTLTFSDALSGVDLSTLTVYHNNNDITASLTSDETGAWGNFTGEEGGNVLTVYLSDMAGNQSIQQFLVMIELGSPPTIQIDFPSDGSQTETNTPTIQISYSDSGGGVNLSSLSVTLDGLDVTSSFDISPTEAVWEVSQIQALAIGSHILAAQISDMAGNASALVSALFQQTAAPANPTLTSIDPDFTISGDSITLTGSGFANPNVYFTGTFGKVKGEITQSSSTSIKAIVPGDATTGLVWVENGSGANAVRSNQQNFNLGLPYAYVACRTSNKIAVIDYRNNTVNGLINIPGTNPIPYGGSITPDGHWLFIANYNLHNVSVIDTLTNTVINNVPLRCAGANPTNPTNVAISPDGSRAFAINNNKVVSIIEIKGVVPSPLPDATLCQAVSNFTYNVGSSPADLAFSFDGNFAVVTTDDAANPTGSIYSIITNRFYQIDAQSNLQYLHYQTTQLFSSGGRNPRSVTSVSSADIAVQTPWKMFIVNLGSTSDMVEYSTLLALPGNLQVGTIITDIVGHPPLYGAMDIAVSPLSDRAFMGFQYTNNIAVLDSVTVIPANSITAATAARAGCQLNNSTSCAGPMIRHTVYTPYNDKVLASIWWNTQAESKIMVLNPSCVPEGLVGTISSGCYSFIANQTGLIGPEGIVVSPLFDRDGDGISDLIEARNVGTNRVNFQPVAANQDPSRAIGTVSAGSLQGGILLPEEGIGYRHWYGTDGIIEDNWGILRLIQVIEDVGRKWNLHYPNGPRISIGDISHRLGGPWVDHDTHQNGRDFDIRYVRSDATEQPFNFNTNPIGQYSLVLTQELIDLFCQTGQVDIIFIDSRAGIAFPQGCNHLEIPNHQHHFHLRVR